MSSNDVEPYLHWMIFGHTEDFEVWLHARLTWPVADMFADRAPLRLEEALRLIYPPRRCGSSFKTLGDQPCPWTPVVPEHGRGLVAAVREPFGITMQTEVDRHQSLDDVLIKAAQKDVAELVSVA